VSVYPGSLLACDVGYLPIIAAFVKRLGVVDEVNRLCPSNSDVSAGEMVLALILDTLSGRRPLYRLEDRFGELDTRLLFGRQIDPSKLNDDAAGRTLDLLHECGTGAIFTAVSVRGVKQFHLDTRRAHHDTTSLTLFGDYDLYQKEDHGHPFVITNGYNKDHRPDLKQLVHSLVCVDRGIPVASRMFDGNESDKTINHTVLSEVSDVMRGLGRFDPLYVADAAMVTKENLDLLSDEEKGTRFVTRFPRSYKECVRAIERAVAADSWVDLGILSRQRPTPKRKGAHYRGFETQLIVYDTAYRALVVHSDAKDKRSLKKFERDLHKDYDEMERLSKELEKTPYACRPDAEATLKRLARGKFHRLFGEIEEIPRYARGRPKADETRRVQRVDYCLKIRIEPDEQAIAGAQREAGCFVLLTNIPCHEVGSYELLDTYKAQDSVEKNFAFLKDDAIVNSLFLKSPARLEALGLILVLSLMVWRLMERCMRNALNERGWTIQGWDKKPTTLPTSFMMTTKFPSVLVVRTDQGTCLAKPFKQVQLDYLHILGLSEKVFLDPMSASTVSPELGRKSWETTG
jgi:transposase